MIRNLFDILASYLPWLRYYRTGRPPAQAGTCANVYAGMLPQRAGKVCRLPSGHRGAHSSGDAMWWGPDRTDVILPPAPLRPCPFCGRPAETNGIAVWCPTLTHGLMTRAQWQGRV